jgi:hypothetical protein
MQFESTGGELAKGVEPDFSLSCLKTGGAELSALYASLQAGNMPSGPSRGKTLFFPGTVLTTPFAVLASWVWQGKRFDLDQGTMTNQVFFGFHALSARLSRGESWWDRSESLILDYAEAPFPFSKLRDEIREVSPGLYLGKAFSRTRKGPRFLLDFVLDFRPL